MGALKHFWAIWTTLFKHILFWRGCFWVAFIVNIIFMQTWHNCSHQCTGTILRHLDWTVQTHVSCGEDIFEFGDAALYDLGFNDCTEVEKPRKNCFWSQMEHFIWRRLEQMDPWKMWDVMPSVWRSQNSNISWFCLKIPKGKILLRLKCCVIYDSCFTVLWFHVFYFRIPLGQILVCHQVLLKRPKPSEGGDHQVSEQHQSWGFLPPIWFHREKTKSLPSSLSR